MKLFFHEALLVINFLFFSQNIFTLHSGLKGLPKWLSGTESACQSRWCRKLGFNPLVRCPGVANAIHSGILAWNITGTEKSSGLQSVGSQGVRHD